jgi:hypothetical protein
VYSWFGPVVRGSVLIGSPGEFKNVFDLDA